MLDVLDVSSASALVLFSSGELLIDDEDEDLSFRLS